MRYRLASYAETCWIMRAEISEVSVSPRVGTGCRDAGCRRYGPGIDDEHIHSAPQPFHRLDRNKPGGYWSGLSMISHARTVLIPIFPVVKRWEGYTFRIRFLSLVPAVMRTNVSAVKARLQKSHLRCDQNDHTLPCQTVALIKTIVVQGHE